MQIFYILNFLFNTKNLKIILLKNTYTRKKYKSVLFINLFIYNAVIY